MPIGLTPAGDVDDRFSEPADTTAAEALRFEPPLLMEITTILVIQHWRVNHGAIGGGLGLWATTIEISTRGGK